MTFNNDVSLRTLALTPVNSSQMTVGANKLKTVYTLEMT
jgi:hypothetical protein